MKTKTKNEDAMKYFDTIYQFKKYFEKKAENDPHEIAELICLKCFDRAIHTYPERTLLKHIQCKCGEVGYLIKTGQTLPEVE